MYNRNLMKKVRFETPSKLGMHTNTMQNYECHSPRPFVERQFVKIDCDVIKQMPLVFTNDPVQRFENSDSSPYPVVNKTVLNAVSKIKEQKAPSSELDLSMLDCSQPRCTASLPKLQPILQPEKIKRTFTINGSQQPHTPLGVLTAIENKPLLQPPNTLRRDNEFFLKRDNLGKLSRDPLHQQFNNLILNKENNCVIKANDSARQGATNVRPEQEQYESPRSAINEDCRCYQCIKIVDYARCTQNMPRNMQQSTDSCRSNCNSHHCMPQTHVCNCNMNIVKPLCHCTTHQSPMKAQDAVDKKTWAIEKYERTQKGDSLEVEKQKNVFKEKREPTVADLFKIIKLQNEQLQLLQEKVDKFISAHNHDMQEKQKPIANYVTEQMAVQTLNSEQHKISIGVMTSFEMVRTSTVINKEIVKQSEAQIQCNRSQFSIKEVVSKKATNLNFLDGIPPVSKNVEENGMNGFPQPNFNNYNGDQTANVMEDKTLNELSLYNVQVDNATTPMMSPEQSLYLDIRDYSGSDSGSDDQSNVGWTYYNKVMTHVNGMLQDSDIPSSASALYRQTKQRCLQMQVDKSNVSAKRVTFGDDPLGFEQQHIATPTDTSLKMNQLAAKYLKNVPGSHTPSPRAIGEMSFATKNYMERHQLLQGQQHGQNTPPQPDLPRFLDITALKQQTKLI